jgi:hypothetical protein
MHTAEWWKALHEAWAGESYSCGVEECCDD